MTILTKARRRHLVNSEIVDACHKQIARAAAAEKFHPLAECYMPDHLHLLVEGTAGDSDLRAFVKRAKQLSAYHVKRQHGITLWAKGYYERVVREDDDLGRYVTYIRNNPVKAGLVVTPDDYQFLWVDPRTTRDLKVAPTGGVLSRLHL